jgi:hypothetical protein
MARYRFNWENLPARLLRAVADDLQLDGPPAAALRKAYGARPKATFVADTWPILLKVWLPRAKEARLAIVEELQSRMLGNWDVKTRSAADQLAYLRSCRNSTALRQTVLTQLILAGEADLAPVPKAKPAPPDSPRPRIETSDTHRTDKKSLTEFVDQALRSILGVSELQRDDDGDGPIRAGSSVCYVHVDEHDDEPSRVVLICPLVNGVDHSPDLLASLNEINLQLVLGRVFLNESHVVLEAELLADTLSPQELNWALDLAKSAADYFDTKLVARFGGSTFFDEEGGDGVEV